VPCDKLNEALYSYPDDKMTVPDEIKELCRNVDKQFIDFNLKKHPSHMHGLVREFYTNILGAMIMLPRVIEKLLENGELMPLTDIQKKSVFSVLFLANDE
jgi:hypothetical protein